MNKPNTADELVWEDTFAGDSLDRSKWECEVNGFRGGNNELQMYADDLRNVRVENGRLILEAHKGDTNIQGTVLPWSSGRIRSKYRGDWTYGWFEARMRLPKGRGFWPAFWLLPTDQKLGPWPMSGEIDIMEAKGDKPRETSAAVHFGPLWPHNKYEAKVPAAVLPRKEPDFTQNFHDFGLHWQCGRLEWFVDRRLVYTVTADTIRKSGGDPAAFDERFHIVLNLAVGGNLPGDPDRTTPDQGRLEVEWVRVYQ